LIVTAASDAEGVLAQLHARGESGARRIGRIIEGEGAVHYIQ
jgi:hypothetical protein